MPNGFLPDEDQGAVFISIRLPDSASVERADAATRRIENIVSRIPGVAGTLTLGGLDIATRTNPIPMSPPSLRV
jgi:hydrophobic/amphiphilic exporter-1 (mainly G- bacteria), HAE1 family